MLEVLQVTGALLVLIAYVLAQLRVLDDTSYRYLVLNLVGSGIMAVLALIGRQWGFLLLEGAWAIVSACSLLRKATAGGRRAAT